MFFRTSHNDLPGGGRWSVAMRLTAWYVGSSFVILLAASTVLYFILVSNLRREQDHFLADKVRVLREMLRQHPEEIGNLKEEVEQTWAPRQYAQVYARVLGSSGQIIAESPRMGRRLRPQAFPPPVPLNATPEQGMSLYSTRGEPVRAQSAETQIGPDGSTRGVIQVALDTELAGELLSQYRQTLLVVLGAGLAVCAAAGYWLVRASLKPLRQIAATAQRVRSTSLNQRIDTTGLPSDLLSLGVRFNAMLERLEDSFSRLSRFSADIAHELRTPVNNMRIEVEVALGKGRSAEEYRETLGSCLEECERLSRIIDSMLFIARAEDPRTLIARESVDVNHELGLVRDFYEVPAAEGGVELRIECPPQTRADLDRTLFQRAVSNLVANAIHHTPRGGRVAVTAIRHNGELRVDVQDTGTGIAPEDLPHVFDRFYRADRARSTAAGNVGLGLAIVKSIVSLHGGHVAAQSTPNQGTRMTIIIPAGDSALRRN